MLSASLLSCGGAAFETSEPAGSHDAALLEQQVASPESGTTGTPEGSSSSSWDASADVVDELLEHDAQLDSVLEARDASADVVDELHDARPDVVVPPLQCVSSLGSCSGPWPYACPNNECCNRPSCL